MANTLTGYPKLGEKVRYLGGITGTFADEAEVALEIGKIYRVVEERPANPFEQIFGIAGSHGRYVAIHARPVGDAYLWSLGDDELECFELVDPETPADY